MNLQPKQFYRFYPDSRSALYQLGIPEFTCLVRQSGTLYEWTVSAPIQPNHPEMVLVEMGIASTLTTAETAIDTAIRHLTAHQFYLPYIWSI